MFAEWFRILPLASANDNKLKVPSGLNSCKDFSSVAAGRPYLGLQPTVIRQ